MYANSVSMYPTYFLRAVDLIQQARDEYKVPSENWPSPTKWSFGIPNDHYYAEIWSDGMDWQTSYWILEEYQLMKPSIKPFIIFENYTQQETFNDGDFSNLVRGAMYYRRDSLWSKMNNYGFYTDFTWPYLSLEDNGTQFDGMALYSFEHASQPKVEFFMGKDYIPPEYRYFKKLKGDTLNSKIICPGGG